MSNNDFTIPASLQDAPDALTGLALIQAMSIASQGLIDVKKPTGPARPVSLNILMVAEPGQRKTSVDSVLFKAKAKESSR